MCKGKRRKKNTKGELTNEINILMFAKRKEKRELEIRSWTLSRKRFGCAVLFFSRLVVFEECHQDIEIWLSKVCLLIIIFDIQVIISIWCGLTEISNNIHIVSARKWSFINTFEIAKVVNHWISVKGLNFKDYCYIHSETMVTLPKYCDGLKYVY